MNRVKWLTVGAVAALLFWNGWDGLYGQRSRRLRVRTPNTNVDLRLAALEQRVLVLETLLSVQSTPVTQTDLLNTKSVEQWERDLVISRQRLEHSERMARKGYISKFALFDDQLAVQRAIHHLALAQGDQRGAARAELQIGVLQAERDLASANADLKLTQVQTRYGVGASTNYRARVTALSETVEDAQQRLADAQAALRQLETAETAQDQNQ